jgi:hypothetical protein
MRYFTMEGMMAVMLPIVLMPAFLVSLNWCSQAYEECRYRICNVL